MRTKAVESPRDAPTSTERTEWAVGNSAAAQKAAVAGAAMAASEAAAVGAAAAGAADLLTAPPVAGAGAAAMAGAPGPRRHGESKHAHKPFARQRVDGGLDLHRLRPCLGKNLDPDPDGRRLERDLDVGAVHADELRRGGDVGRG
eukprot:scaffold1440_cov114-Isochrysis_galbana.AAC.14